MDNFSFALDSFLQKHRKFKPSKMRDFFGRTPLHYAACKKMEIRAEIYKQLLLIVGNRDVEDRYGMTPLLTAAARGNAEIVEVLLEDGANKDGKFQNWTALHTAAEKGHLGVVKRLMDAGADATLATTGGRTALHLAVLGCHNYVISKMLERDFDAVDSSGRTALHLAAQSDFIEKILAEEQRKLEREGRGEGAAPEEKGEVTTWVSKLIEKIGQQTIVSNGKTALHLAAGRGHERMVFLFSKYKEIVAEVDNDEKTALHCAAEQGHHAVVQQLLGLEGVELNCIDENGRTPLSLAAMNGQDLVVEQLMKSKVVDLNHRDYGDQTPLSLAAMNGHEPVVAQLINNMGVDLNLADGYDQSPLSLAAENGKEMVVGLLLRHEGVEIDSKDNSLRTPLHWAAWGGHWHVVRELLKNNAKIDLTDARGRTALNRATLGRQEAVEQLLIDNGADLKMPPRRTKAILFKDALRRKFTFPLVYCNTWNGVTELIRQAFLHVASIGPQVANGHYDLKGLSGETILPQNWPTVIGDNHTITMHMWPMPDSGPPTPRSRPPKPSLSPPTTPSEGGMDPEVQHVPGIMDFTNNVVKTYFLATKNLIRLYGLGRKFTFRFEHCAKWSGMEEHIRQAFLGEGFDRHIAEHSYDLIGPTGEIILPQVWESVIEDDWDIMLVLWPGVVAESG